MTHEPALPRPAAAPLVRLLGRRTVLRGAAASAAAPAIPAVTAAAAHANSGLPASGVTLRWLGTAGWRIDAGTRTVLVDPYLTRFPTGLHEGRFNPRTRLRTLPERVHAHVGSPELILVTHSHWDHLNDVPYIAKITGARVVGTETTYHLLVALGVPAGQISVVKGGEVLDFAGIVTEVVPALHSRDKRHAYFAPGTLNTPPHPAPKTVADLPEGNTLAFQITLGDKGSSVLFMGASDFSERAMHGLRPDLAMAAVPSSTATRAYVPRLLKALDAPGIVVPVHWDNFERPLTGSPVPDPAMDLAAFCAAVTAASPTTRVVVPDYRSVYDTTMRPVTPRRANGRAAFEDALTPSPRTR
ncbi:MBL fold metallo-hydrolase [Streptomyces sp. NPDC048224]|uniref:MBL fold metallo-hydrolase n=1 Tax=Streptomyces sp. NPDC048224 TaxID=3154500 RepID=UPI0033E598CB